MKYGGCFSAETTVLTNTGHRRPLSDLQIGEKIQAMDPTTNKIIFSEILLFLDYDPHQKREFLQIFLSSGRTLTVTPSHLLILDDRTVKYAENLHSGDTLLVSDTKNRLIPDKIVHVKGVWRTGVFAPLTSVGTLIVNDVVASCYATIDSQWLAHLAFSPVRLVFNVRNGLYRLWTVVSQPVVSWGENYKSALRKPDSGVFWYAKMLYFTADYLLPSHLHE